MQAWIRVVRLALGLLLIGGCQPAPVVFLPADVIYHNATVVTGVPEAARAEAR